MAKPNVAIVGATGAVGEQMRLILEARNFPVKKLHLFSSSRSAGKKLPFKAEEVTVEELTESSFADIDLALFSAGSSISKKFAPLAVSSGAIVIDNSSAFRMDKSVPLVVPEINHQDINWHQGIIANPNCSTIQMVMILNPLHLHFELKRVAVSTYQAVSGTGKEAVNELINQSKDVLAGRQTKANIYPHQIAFNVLPHIDVFLDNGYSYEEWKMINETRKIMHLPELNITATAVRVPVINCHSESVNAEFEKQIDLDKVRNVLAAAPGVKVVDDLKNNSYPMPIDAGGRDECFVGRIHRDISVKNGLSFWVVSDNLRKGAALNAIQIAELLVK